MTTSKNQRYFLNTFHPKKTKDKIKCKRSGKDICSTKSFNKVFKDYDESGKIEEQGYTAIIEALIALTDEDDENTLKSEKQQEGKK